MNMNAYKFCFTVIISFSNFLFCSTQKHTFNERNVTIELLGNRSILLHYGGVLDFYEKKGDKKEEMRKISIYDLKNNEIGSFKSNSTKEDDKQVLSVEIKPSSLCSCDNFYMKVEYRNAVQNQNFHFKYSPEKYIEDHLNELVCVNPENNEIRNKYNFSSEAWILECVSGNRETYIYDNDNGYVTIPINKCTDISRFKLQSCDVEQTKVSSTSETKETTFPSNFMTEKEKAEEEETEKDWFLIIIISTSAVSIVALVVIVSIICFK